MLYKVFKCKYNIYNLNINMWNLLYIYCIISYNYCNLYFHKINRVRNGFTWGDWGGRPSLQVSVPNLSN